MNAANDESLIAMEHLPEYIRNEFIQPGSPQPAPPKVETGTFHSEIDSFEIGKIMSALKDADGNISQAAKTLAITRQCLQYKMKKFQISINRNISNS